MKAFAFVFIVFGSFAIAQAQTESQKIDFLNRVNDERFFKGLPLYEYSSEADTLAKKRIETLKRHIDSIGSSGVRADVREALHYRSNEDFSWFNKNILPADSAIGWNSECTVMLWNADTNEVKNPSSMSFRMWKNSPDHWSGIMDKDFKRLAFAYEFYESGMIAVLVLWEGVEIEKGAQ